MPPLAAFLAGAGIFALLRRLRGRREAHASRKIDLLERADEAGKESFPASDPPAWTLGEDER